MTVTQDIEAVYPYIDENGQLLYEVVRKSGKRFLQRIRNGGGYIWKLNGVRRVPYRLPGLLAADPAAIVYVVEGEKDVESLVRRGLVATCNPQGAGQWGKVANVARTVLQGRDVVVIADADDSGRQHGRQVFDSLCDVVRSIEVLEPPNPHNDVTDLLNAGGTLDQLVPMAMLRTAAHAPSRGPVDEGAITAANEPVSVAEAGDATGFPWDDTAGCRRFGPVSESEFWSLPEWVRNDLRWSKKKVDEVTFLVLVPCETNVIVLLRRDHRWSNVLAVDTMAHRMTVTAPPPWRTYEPAVGSTSWDADADPVRMVDWFSRAYGLQLSAQRNAACALVVAQDRKFHPIQLWLGSLPKHDGTRRVERFFPLYFGTKDNLYTRAVGRVLIESLVARAMRPGCKVDTVPVIEGQQGKRKSTACKELVGEQWFAESTNDIGTKDAQLALHGKWLIEMPELAGMTKAQVETVKAFFSRSCDWLRPPYGKTFKDMPRSSCCIATTNDERYLKDRTGNRRFLPIRCDATTIDVEGIARDRVQLFAEAMEMYRAGVPWWIDDPHVLAAAKEQVQHRETIDPWESIMADWLRGHDGGGGKARGEVGVSTESALLALGVSMERQSPSEAARVGTILRRLGLVMSRPHDRKAENMARARGEKYQRPRIFRWPDFDAEPWDDDS